MNEKKKKKILTSSRADHVNLAVMLWICIREVPVSSFGRAND
jgi:hypothetical protein